MTELKKCCLRLSAEMRSAGARLKVPTWSVRSNTMRVSMADHVPKAPAPHETLPTAPAPVARVAVEADVVAPVLVAWQATREGIGLVECSTPDQLSAAMARLLSARRSMDDAVERLVRFLTAALPPGG